MRRFTLLVAMIAVITTACGGSDVGSAGSITAAPGDPTTTTSTAPGAETTTTLDGSDTTSGASTTTTTEPDQGPGDGTAAPAERFVDIYLIKDGTYADAVVRTVTGPDVAAAALRALMAGPTPAEREAGLDTSIPADVLLLGVTISDGLATVDLSREYEAGGGSFGMLSRLAQVVYTVTQFPSVDRVSFRLDGTPVTVFSAEGISLDGPVDRNDFTGAVPIGPGGASADVWTQADLPDLDGVPRSEQGRVVLVADDDVLNVRSGAGVDHAPVGALLPGVVVRRTGSEAVAGSSTWVEIVVPTGTGWVNEVYLGAVVTADEFAGDESVSDLLDELAAVVSADGDLRTVASARGLYVSHHAAPLRFPAADLADILVDGTTYKWPSAAHDMSDPSQVAELPDRTFAEAVTDRFLSAYADTDTVTSVNTPIEAGNGRPPAAAIPFMLSGFNYIGIHDPGDDPQYEGLDWVTWYVSIDYEDGVPKVVALTVDAWSP